MQTFHLTDEFTDPAAEQAIIAAITQQPDLYWQCIDLLPAEAFVQERGAWRDLMAAVESERQPRACSWMPARDAIATARRLADLLQRRLLAAAQERLAEALYDESRPATELTSILEEEAARVNALVSETNTGRLLWASDLITDVVREAEERRLTRQATGRPVLGLPTGLSRLDALINGLNPGLHLLGGPPGMGKTSLAMQIAVAVTAEAPVVYVSFENSPANLVLKAIASRCGINPQDVQRGWADVNVLRAGAEEWRETAARIGFVEGCGRLTVTEVRAKVLQALNRHKVKQGLVIVDYLQLWAKASQEYRGLQNVRERVEALGAALRELALRVSCPVLALSSQNRAQGNYGSGKGAAALDSLKESGDLEYAADTVLFLTEARERQAQAPARAVDLTVAKNRQGDIGSVELIFRPDLASMREVTSP